MPSAGDQINELLEDETRRSFPDPNSKKARARRRRQRLYGLGSDARFPRVRRGEGPGVGGFRAGGAPARRRLAAEPRRAALRPPRHLRARRLVPHELLGAVRAPRGGRPG